MLSAIFSEPVVHRLGWALVHSIWQGLMLGAVLWLVLVALRKKAAQARYLAGCLALLLSGIAPVITFYSIPTPPAQAAGFQSAVEPESAAAATEAPALFVGKPVWIKRGPDRGNVSAALEGLFPYAVVSWFLGVIILSGRLLLGWWEVQRIRKSRAERLGDRWEEFIQTQAQRLKVSGPVRLLRSAMVEAPTVIGWLRPVILIPAGALVNLTPAQLEAVLVHELAHIARHDYLVNWFQKLIETVLFYHPAVWWISRQIDEERENCCDDLTLTVCPDRVEYARALAAFEELRGVSFSLGAGGGSLLRRIRRLSGMPHEQNRSGWWLAGVVSLMIGAAVISLAGTPEKARPVRPSFIFGEESAKTAELTKLPSEGSEETQPQRDRGADKHTIAFDPAAGQPLHSGQQGPAETFCS